MFSLAFLDSRIPRFCSKAASLLWSPPLAALCFLRYWSGYLLIFSCFLLMMQFHKLRKYLLLSEMQYTFVIFGASKIASRLENLVSHTRSFQFLKINNDFLKFSTCLGKIQFHLYFLVVFIESNQIKICQKIYNVVWWNRLSTVYWHNILWVISKSGSLHFTYYRWCCLVIWGCFFTYN